MSFCEFFHFEKRAEVNKQIPDDPRTFSDPMEKMEHDFKNKGAHDHGDEYLPYMHDMSKEKDIFDRPNKEKFQIIEQYKNEGNAFVKQGDYEKAVYMYKKALLYIIYLIPTDSEDEAYEKLNETVNLNISLAFLNLKEREEALKHAEEALRLNPRNPKGFYRKLKALAEMDKFIAFHLTMKKARELQANSSEFDELDKIVKEKEKLYRKTEKKVYQQIFEKE